MVFLNQIDTLSVMVVTIWHFFCINSVMNHAIVVITLVKFKMKIHLWKNIIDRDPKYLISDKHRLIKCYNLLTQYI